MNSVRYTSQLIAGEGVGLPLDDVPATTAARAAKDSGSSEPGHQARRESQPDRASGAAQRSLAFRFPRRGHDLPRHQIAPAAQARHRLMKGSQRIRLAASQRFRLPRRQSRFIALVHDDEDEVQGEEFVAPRRRRANPAPKIADAPFSASRLHQSPNAPRSRRGMRGGIRLAGFVSATGC